MSDQPTLHPKHARYFAKIVSIQPTDQWRTDCTRRAEEIARADAEYVRLVAGQDEPAATARLIHLCRENQLLRVADFLEDFEQDSKAAT